VVALKGTIQAGAFHAWQRWLHARADFADDHRLTPDAIPYTVPAEAWTAVV
jgi:hypothetical protein